MDAMGKHPRLKRRGAVYQFRCTIPADLIDHYGKREITESLHTKDPTEALRLVRARSERQEQEFDRIRAGRTITKLAELTDEQIQALADWYYAGMLKWDEQARMQGLSEEDYEERSAEVADSFFPFALARGDTSRAGYLAHITLKLHGITLPKKSPSYSKLTTHS
jgi:hypothetical protein